MKDHVHSLSSYKEIITLAACGHGAKNISHVVDIEIKKGELPSKILGSYIADARVKAGYLYGNTGELEITGQYSVHVWHEINRETYIAKTMVPFDARIPINFQGGLEVLKVVRSRASYLKEPWCANVNHLQDGHQKIIRLEVSFSVRAELIGEARIKVRGRFLEENSKEIYLVNIQTENSLPSPAAEYTSEDEELVDDSDKN